MTRKRPTTRRGTIFVTAIWVTIIIGAVVLVFARSMRVELTAAANRVGVHQCDSIELGVEQYVMAELDNIDGEADYVLSLPGEQLRIGDGYAWLLRPAADESTYDFGITDEASKLNLNVVAKAAPTGQTSPQLILLPGLSNNQQAADSIVDWIKPASQNVTGGDGAQSDYYESLPEPYQAKNLDLETVEELYLVQGVDSNLMYGIDRNRNGVIEAGEASQGTTPTDSNGDSADRGLFPFVTIYSQEPDTDIQGNKRINLATPGANSNAIQQQLTTAGMSAPAAAKVARAMQQYGRFLNVFDLANKANLTTQDLSTVADKLSFQAPTAAAGGRGGGGGTTATPTMLKGLINVNTAPREVLMTLTGLSDINQNDIDNLISERQRDDTSTIMWVADSLPMNKAAEIGQYLTNRSFVYSADIVAVSGDGRAFKRVRIVVDATTSPPKIIYRKDLTSYGWPLPQSVRDSLRQGKGPGPSLVNSGGFGSMGAVNRQQ